MMPDSQTDHAAPAPTTPFLCPPRLGIRHLLLLTTVVAVSMKLMAAVEMVLVETTARRAPTGVDPISLALLRLHYFLYCVTYPAAIVGSATVLLAKYRDRPGRLQPGHWFVLTGGVAALMAFSAHLLLFLSLWLATDDSGPLRYSDHAWASVVLSSQAFLFTGIYGLATWACRKAKWWQSTFALAAIANLFRCLTQIPSVTWWLLTWINLQPGALQMGRGVFSAAAMVVFLAAVAIDLVGRPHRDWLHWLGIAIVSSTIAIMPAISWIARQLF